MSDGLLKIELHIPEGTIERLKAGMTAQDGVDLMQAADDALVSSKHWEREWTALEPTWKPLSPKWVAIKKANGWKPVKWQATCETRDSLEARVPLTTSGGKALSRQVTITENSEGRVEAEWRITRPAAGGYFHRNNQMRPWLNPIAAGTASHAAALKACVAVATKIMKRIFGG